MSEPVLYRERYEPLALAGRGAQGEVWMARDHLHDRTVALKIRRATNDERPTLLREARTLLDMRPHDGLPLVRDDFFVDDRYVIVMDWIEGTNLASPRPRTFDEILDHLDRVARALDHLHGHASPIVHRDVKPANIIVKADGGTVLVDLGLAGAVDTTYGTPAYAAPELARGDEVSTAADVFSLAVTAYELLTQQLPEAGRIADLVPVPDAHRDRVRQALAAGLSIDPSLRPNSAGAFVASLRPPTTSNNLPAELSTFVGRDAATAQLRDLLASTRSLTLVGPGGSGKTRLALRLADAALPSYPGGLWLAELAGVTDPELVTSRVSVALGVRTPPGAELIDGLIAFLGEGEQLLVLDNCEHVIDACAHLVETLLRSCPHLTVVATSREALRTTGETVWQTPTLDDDDAVALFVDRAPLGVDVDPDDPLIGDICQRLDGIPLAIELAAAQLRSTSLAEIASALGEALSVLTGGVRTNPRHETMRATIEWSYLLLQPDDQLALRRLSVFAGGVTRAAAAMVCDSEASLDALVDASLLSASADRFQMLETVRQYSNQRLEEDGEAADLRTRHAEWVVGFVERSGGDEPPQAWLERLTADHDNIEAALSHALQRDAQKAARIARAAVLYWARRGYWVQGRQWVMRTLASPDIDNASRAELLKRAGDMARVQGDLPSARAHLEEAVAMYRGLDDREGLALALTSLGLVMHSSDALEEAIVCHEESRVLAQDLNDPACLAMALNNLAIVYSTLGDMERTASLLQECLDVKRSSGDGEGTALVMYNLAEARLKTGERDEARRLLDEALVRTTEINHVFGRSLTLNALAAMDVGDGEIDRAQQRASEGLELMRELNYRDGQSTALHVLGQVASAEGDLDAAVARHQEALEVQRAIGARLGIATSLVRLAAAQIARGEATTGVRLIAEAADLREASGLTKDDDETQTAIASAREALGDEVFEREWARARGSATVASADTVGR